MNEIKVEAPKAPERYRQILCDVFIANHNVERKETQDYVMWWKARRNANLALKKRLKGGPGSSLTLDTKTMSVFTWRAAEYKSYRDMNGPRRPLGGKH
jgi:hypothetical protein